MSNAKFTFVWLALAIASTVCQFVFYPKFLGGLSMEIYLCHMVMFRVVEKVHLEKFIENPHLLYWTWCVVGIAAAVVFSWIVKEKVFPWCGNHIKLKL